MCCGRVNISLRLALVITRGWPSLVIDIECLLPSGVFGGGISDGFVRVEARLQIQLDSHQNPAPAGKDKAIARQGRSGVWGRFGFRRLKHAGSSLLLDLTLGWLLQLIFLCATLDLDDPTLRVGQPGLCSWGQSPKDTDIDQHWANFDRT